MLVHNRHLKLCEKLRWEELLFQANLGGKKVYDTLPYHPSQWKKAGHGVCG
jgi:hypothetical protein